MGLMDPNIRPIYIKGPAGPRGAYGADAYQVAVAHGFEGSVDDWLASLVGPQGIKGEDSTVPGPQGIQGETGPQGPQGEKGDQGIQGVQGEQGIQGERGAQGDIGPQGLKGDTGEQGVQGIQGDPGPQGIQGIQGPKGDKGDAGADGTGVTILGSLASEAELPASGSAGDAYLISGDLYVWNGTAWENVGTIQGPKGDKGDKGDIGPEGPQGEQGIQGIQGPIGDQGEPGVAGSWNDLTDKPIAFPPEYHLHPASTVKLAGGGSVSDVIKSPGEIAMTDDFGIMDFYDANWFLDRAPKSYVDDGLAAKADKVVPTHTVGPSSIAVIAIFEAIGETTSGPALPTGLEVRATSETAYAAPYSASFTWCQIAEGEFKGAYLFIRGSDLIPV